MTQLLGVAMARYVLGAETVAAISQQQLIDNLAPSLEATLGN